jgi:hypothetical protein
VVWRRLLNGRMPERLAVVSAVARQPAPDPNAVFIDTAHSNLKDFPRVERLWHRPMSGLQLVHDLLFLPELQGISVPTEHCNGPNINPHDWRLVLGAEGVFLVQQHQRRLLLGRKLDGAVLSDIRRTEWNPNHDVEEALHAVLAGRVRQVLGKFGDRLVTSPGAASEDSRQRRRVGSQVPIDWITWRPDQGGLVMLRGAEAAMDSGAGSSAAGPEAL